MSKMLSPVHHPGEELLADYAAGALTGGRALIVSAHLAYCPTCRGRVAVAEAVSGELFELEPGLDVEGEVAPASHGAGQETPQMTPGGSFAFAPRHIQGLLAGSEGRWVDVWFGVKELPVPGYSPAARLLWIPAGRRMPRHDHHGEEMTLVLKGNFSDATGRFSTGDLQLGQPGLEHQPHAGRDEDCICLVVEQGGLKLSGWLGRLVAWRGGRTDRNAA